MAIESVLNRIQCRRQARERKRVKELREREEKNTRKNTRPGNYRVRIRFIWNELSALILLICWSAYVKWCVKWEANVIATRLNIELWIRRILCGCCCCCCCSSCSVVDLLKHTFVIESSDGRSASMTFLGSWTVCDGLRSESIFLTLWVHWMGFSKA